MRESLMLLVLTCAVGLSITGVSAKLHNVGGAKGWDQGVNYTEWSDHEQIYAGDWIGFKYKTGYFDVMEVNETGYEKCLADNPIGNWTKGPYLQLNDTGRYFFICSKGYCFNGMKVSVLVQDPPAAAPAPHNNEAISDSGRRNILLNSIIIAAIFLMK
ncbi:early nodulin-like protein 17 [Tasmannia lanceolata]|uniref:early nodulin-like protein 17 n=1 Tax=Tasmannia lanceolata TaxID=3420 RepID=UPI00406291D3